ncbi:MAG: anthranilate phosphoribosyltransferase [Pyrinomonadaceae bacterium]
MSGILGKYISEFRSGRSLNGDEAEAFLNSLVDESDENILAEIFREWNKKGIDEDEVYAIAKIMRERCVKVASRHKSFVDIVGTGGSRSKTFNVSTAAAFVVAGEGVAVAKHGNKAATSHSGSTDVLAVLGIVPAADAATAERSLNELGICFMFAPGFHRLSPTLGKVRRRLGFPTIFNCVGPLCNPASAPHQLIGVWSRELVPIMANALARLGTTKSWIVHGLDGLDEISLSGPTFVAEVEGVSVRTFEITPGDFGVRPESVLSCRAESAEESAAIIRDILNPDGSESAARGIVEINSAAAIFLAGHGDSLCEAREFAGNGIRSGHALGKLNSLVKKVKR